MNVWPFNKISSTLVKWLIKDEAPAEMPVCDFARIQQELKPCDVILIEGRSRVSEIIKLTTKSNWSHAALYIGKLHDIKEEALRHKILNYYTDDINEQLVIEGILGKGTVVSPLTNYKLDHIRICRPSALTIEDGKKVIAYAINELGTPYDIRHIFDLLRLLFPFTFIPRHLFSSIFKPTQVTNKKLICSYLLVEAFASVKYPLIPKIRKRPDGTIEFIPRNPRLFTPKDFDYSPYFDIIKYPLFGLQNIAAYKYIPWNYSAISNDNDGIITLPKELIDKIEHDIESKKVPDKKPPIHDDDL